MATYKLYCGKSTILLGDLPDTETGYLDIDYHDDLVSQCLDMVRPIKFHVKGDGDALLEAIKHQHKYIEAAGGLVVNDDGKSLVIIRNGLYDLPKGKVEPGEDIETAAVREVMEETGVPNPQICRPLADTYHFYRWGNDPTIIFKKTYWYLMHHDGTPDTNPQLEEGITSCFWASDSQLTAMPGKTHRNLRILFQLKIDGRI